MPLAAQHRGQTRTATTPCGRQQNRATLRSTVRQVSVSLLCMQVTLTCFTSSNERLVATSPPEMAAQVAAAYKHRAALPASVAAPVHRRCVSAPLLRSLGSCGLHGTATDGPPWHSMALHGSSPYGWSLFPLKTRVVPPAPPTTLSRVFRRLCPREAHGS